MGAWAGSVNHFLDSVRNPRLQDFKFTYLTANRFAYLGKGLSIRDITKDELGWYIRG